MAVAATADLQYKQARLGLGVDGVFYGRVVVTQDASGGEATLTLTEPAARAVGMRAHLLINADISAPLIAAARSGYFSVSGKDRLTVPAGLITRGNLTEITFRIVTAGVVRAMVALGGDLSVLARSWGWSQPLVSGQGAAAGPADRVRVTDYVAGTANTNTEGDITMTLIGLYIDLVPGRRLPPPASLGI